MPRILTRQKAGGMPERILMAVSIAAAGVWIVMSLTYPFGWDQGLFAWVGGMIVQGGLPYRDAWDIKGPLVHYAYALSQWLFGVHLWSIRILDAALLIAAAICVRRLASALTDRVMGGWAAIGFVLWYASQSYWHTAQPDGWAGMLLVIVLTPLVVGARPLSGRPVLACGIAIGLITLLKPIGAAFLLLPIAIIVLERTPRRVSLLAGLVLGWLLPLALAVAWFAWHGALTELVRVHLQYSAAYAALSPGNRLRGLVEYFLSGRLAVTAPVALFGAAVLWRARPPAAALLVGWLALVILLVTVQNRFYAYQWLPMLPAMTVLAIVGLHNVRTIRPLLAFLLGAAMLIECLAPIALEEARFASWVTGRMDRDAYYDAYGEPGDDMKTVRWLREQGKPGSVFVFGWNSSIAWLSGRPTVSRFGYSMPLVLGPEHEFRSPYRAELLSHLREQPPLYVIVGTQSEHIIGASVTLADFPELARLLDTEYREVQRIGKIVVLERR